ncbi:enoyl-CoA hydratase-related protein [Actinocorallia sp. API 0066]|uniref:enoyl-CoA hydratase-related protein n=1 Tax=Actinocorallia sp. API 0066 TaxID=2896846 RepID=UPI001E474369|nr:enoyl-CoA hydratase-related protein [Actinocorallia sp. API 0066]MCD0451652.1 enoyl-CoA hydratase-related protein [Actinocorallia sp. API 0066]
MSLSPELPTLHREGSVFTLDLGGGENRFSPDWMDRVHGLLDAVVGHDGAAALVTTARGKFFSNGLDLEWLGAHPDELVSYVARVQELLARFLTLPVPTAAAVNGHAFGAGAMLATAHDFRFMRADRGYYCFPEVDILIPFTPGMAALIQGKLTPAAAVAAMTTGHRFAAPEAAEAGLVDAAVPLDALVRTAAERVGALAGKDRGTLEAIKATMFAPALAALREAVPA